MASQAFILHRYQWLTSGIRHRVRGININYQHRPVSSFILQICIDEVSFSSVSRKFDERFFFHNNEKWLFCEICSIRSVSVKVLTMLKQKKGFFQHCTRQIDNGRVQKSNELLRLITYGNCMYFTLSLIAKFFLFYFLLLTVMENTGVLIKKGLKSELWLFDNVIYISYVQQIMVKLELCGDNYNVKPYGSCLGK